MLIRGGTIIGVRQVSLKSGGGGGDRDLREAE